MTSYAFLASLATQVTQLTSSIRHARTDPSFVRIVGLDPPALAAAIDTAPVDHIALFGPEMLSVRDSVSRLKDNDASLAALVADNPSSEPGHIVSGSGRLIHSALRITRTKGDHLPINEAQTHSADPWPQRREGLVETAF
ncbi:type 1 periplasmic-binding domain-containing protein [Tateyamaria pelophila]|uniref:hypothetical protein n=1 Tax=Tateyamaria pelophila TaxID=328415 RepID=UPI001CBD34FC|nr:hypothetical protein [Tateyamaria pelophila]